MNRAELQARIHQHIATAVAAISEDIAEYTAGQVKAAVVPPVVRQRGEPVAIHLYLPLTTHTACGLNPDLRVYPMLRDPEWITCEACIAWNVAHNAGAVSRNTSQPAHNTERP